MKRYSSSFIVYESSIGHSKQTVFNVYNCTPFFSNDYKKILMDSVKLEIAFNSKYSDDIYFDQYYTFSDTRYEKFNFDSFKKYRKLFMEKQRSSEIYKFCKFSIIDNYDHTVDGYRNGVLILNYIYDDDYDDIYKSSSSSQSGSVITNWMRGIVRCFMKK